MGRTHAACPFCMLSFFCRGHGSCADRSRCKSTVYRYQRLGSASSVAAVAAAWMGQLGAQHGQMSSPSALASCTSLNGFLNLVHADMPPTTPHILSDLADAW